MPGNEIYLLSLLTLLTVWPCSTLSLPGAFAHSGTEADSIHPGVPTLKGLWRADCQSVQSDLGGTTVIFACPALTSSFLGHNTLIYFWRKHSPPFLVLVT